MISRRALERLCKSDEINRSRSNTIYDVLEIVFDRLFIDLSTRIFQHANQHDRDTILRALSFNVVHFELDKLFCSVSNENVIEIFDTLTLIEFKRKKENANEDIRGAQKALWCAQEALFFSRNSSRNFEGYSSTSNSIEMRIAK